ncbi:hypothetical protein C8R45DRAFT_1148882 [Mycena sanguinolenta]|nr:hypothetical protein C8R45DRAFT_1148882 [Mycena sanguinolenta]
MYTSMTGSFNLSHAPNAQSPKGTLQEKEWGKAKGGGERRRVLVKSRISLVGEARILEVSPSPHANDIAAPRVGGRPREPSKRTESEAKRKLTPPSPQEEATKARKERRTQSAHCSLMDVCAARVEETVEVEEQGHVACGEDQEGGWTLAARRFGTRTKTTLNPERHENGLDGGTAFQSRQYPFVISNPTAASRTRTSTSVTPIVNVHETRATQRQPRSIHYSPATTPPCIHHFPISYRGQQNRTAVDAAFLGIGFRFLEFFQGGREVWRRLRNVLRTACEFD